MVRSWDGDVNAHTHTHIYIYIYKGENWRIIDVSRFVYCADAFRLPGFILIPNILSKLFFVWDIIIVIYQALCFDVA